MTSDAWTGTGPPTPEAIDAWIAADAARLELVARIRTRLVEALGAPLSEPERIERVARRIAFCRAHEQEAPGTRPLVRGLETQLRGRTGER